MFQKIAKHPNWIPTFILQKLLLKIYLAFYKIIRFSSNCGYFLEFIAHRFGIFWPLGPLALNSTTWLFTYWVPHSLLILLKYSHTYWVAAGSTGVWWRSKHRRGHLEATKASLSAWPAQTRDFVTDPRRGNSFVKCVYLSFYQDRRVAATWENKFSVPK